MKWNFKSIQYFYLNLYSRRILHKKSMINKIPHSYLHPHQLNCSQNIYSILQYQLPINQPFGRSRPMGPLGLWFPMEWFCFLRNKLSRNALLIHSHKPINESKAIEKYHTWIGAAILMNCHQRQVLVLFVEHLNNHIINSYI